MGESSHSDPSNDLAMDSVLPKAESLRDVSITSSMSTPEAEVEELDPDTIQAHKRKGGRKPVGKRTWRSKKKKRRTINPQQQQQQDNYLPV